VSVVIPARNGAATIAQCLEALLAQSYPRELTEILVVENGSTDETSMMAGRYPVTLLPAPDVKTSYAARNRGIAAARGDIVAFTDCDCIADREWLARLLAPFADARVEAVAGTIGDAPAENLCEELSARVNPFARPVRGGLKTLLTGNAALRRTTLLSLGLFDDSLPTAGDVDLGWRLQRTRRDAVVDAPDAIVRHRHRGTLRGVFGQYRRYGLSEVLLSMLHSGGAGATSSWGLFVRLLDQTRAAAWCMVNLARRSVCLDRRKRLRPLFLLTVETASIVGKLEGIVITRGLRRNPYRS
jgi:glycosyltransferase involved in cell wall biosynthesis